MTIPDMATAFQFNGTTATTSVATVDCHNGKRHQVSHGWVGDDPLMCNHPQFSLSRDFTLPIVNRTAASVYDRIIPAPGGDCKLIDTASNPQSFPTYNLQSLAFRYLLPAICQLLPLAILV